MFDLPVETAVDRRAYSKFTKFLSEQGFVMFQKSVYVKLSINEASVNLLEKTIKNNVPKNGVISMLTITEKQFNDITVFLGDFSSDVLMTTERVIEL